MERRVFIKSSFLLPELYHSVSKPKKKILVLGGTNFLGPAIIRQFSRSCDLTLLNRGITNPQLFAELPLIIADRTKSLEHISAQYRDFAWDYIIDIWPEDPSVVENACKFFKHAKKYVFISSVVVYKDFKAIGIDESYPLKEATTFEAGKYSFNKVLCENVVRRYYPEKHIIIRPGSVTGDRDPSFALRSWTWRMKRSDLILAPGDGNDMIQVIDVNDVAAFIGRCVNESHFGEYNLVAPSEQTTFRSFLETTKEITRSSAQIRWMPYDLLIKHNINNRQQMPLFTSRFSSSPGFQMISNEKVKQTGFTFKAFRDIIKTSVKKYNSDRILGNIAEHGGLSLEEEARLLTYLSDIKS